MLCKGDLKTIILLGVLPEIGARHSGFSPSNALNPQFKAKTPLGQLKIPRAAPSGIFSWPRGIFNFEPRISGIFQRKSLLARPISYTKSAVGVKMGLFLDSVYSGFQRRQTSKRPFSEKADQKETIFNKRAYFQPKRQGSFFKVLLELKRKYVT